MRIGAVSLIAALLAGTPVLAQTGTVVGTVTASEGATPIVSAQVVVVGTARGAVSRDDGRYTITDVPAGTYSMRVARIGFAPDTIRGVVVRDGQETVVNFQMRSVPTALAGVVVIGYGSQEAKDLTGSVKTVTPEQFNTGRIVSPEELIRGKVAGVQVSENNEPGGGIAVRIRGGTSTGAFGASNEPLYVIDGVPIVVGGGSTVNGRNALNFLNSSDIESMTILKDASSTAIYGNRGANGVVIITTKGGGSGPAFTYDGNVSGGEVTGGPEFVNAEQYRAAVAQYAPANLASLGNANVNWLKAIQQSSRGSEHNIGFNGRRDAATYRLGLGLLDQEGVLIGSKTQRASASINYNDRLLDDRLSLRTHFRGSRSRDDYTPGGVLGSATAFAPTQPQFDSDGGYFQYRDANGVLLLNAPNNPLEDLRFVQDEGTILRSIGNVEAEYRMPFLAGLSTTVRAGYDLNRADRNGFTPNNIASQLKGDPLRRGSVSRANHNETHTVLDAYANYRTTIPQLASTTLDVTAGVSGENFDGSYNGYGARGLSTNQLGTDGVPVFELATPGVSVTRNLLRSQFGRANVNILDRYLLTATVRRDGSSRFGQGKEYGVFPSAAIAWRVLNEPALRSTMERIPTLSDAKVRLSYGKNGNESIGCNYCAYGRYQVGNNQAQQQFGNDFVTTIRPIAFDANLKWEELTSTNVGLDLGFLDNRITSSIDYYNKKTYDLLIRVPTAAGTALSNEVLTNLGNVRNRGLEFVVEGDVFKAESRGGFTWNANFNAARNSNELLSIGRPGVTSILTGGVAGGVGTNVQVLQEGAPINSFFVYEARRGADGKVVTTGADTAMFVDRNADGIINTNDRRTFESPAPKWILGHTSSMRFRGFDASTTLRMYLGNYVYNNVASNLGNYGVLGVTPLVPVNLSSSALRYGYTSAQYLSDVYVEDASFLRMDNITLGYTFERFAQLQGARIYGTVQNVFTSTKYTGVDPTANINGLDNNVYPRSRNFVGGVSLGF